MGDIKYVLNNGYIIYRKELPRSGLSVRVRGERSQE